jgi:hypothetical protein
MLNDIFVLPPCFIMARFRPFPIEGAALSLPGPLIQNRKARVIIQKDKPQRKKSQKIENQTRMALIRLPWPFGA